MAQGFKAGMNAGFLILNPDLLPLIGIMRLSCVPLMVLLAAFV